MKVLFLQHGLGYGGATQSLMVMQEALSGHVEMTTFLKRNKRLNKILSGRLIHSTKISEAPLLNVHSYSEGTSSLRELELARNWFPEPLIRFINEEKIDILHINSSVFANVLPHVRQHTACRIVVHIREMLPYGPTHPVDRFIIETTEEFADRIVAISPNELRFFKNSPKVCVLPNPHNFTVTDRLIAEAGSPRRRLIVGMCANFTPVKGHLVFIKAIPLIQAALPGVKTEFRIIGYPSGHSLRSFLKRLAGRGYKRRVDQLVKRLKIRSLRMIPFTMNPLPQVAELSVYVRPDLSANPWGRDIIEAMALRKPVVATGSSGFYVKDGVTGFLVEPDDEKKLADAVCALLKNDELRHSMAEAAYKQIRRQSDAEDYGKKLMDIYNGL